MVNATLETSLLGKYSCFVLIPETRQCSCLFFIHFNQEVCADYGRHLFVCKYSNIIMPIETMGFTDTMPTAMLDVCECIYRSVCLSGG